MRLFVLTWNSSYPCCAFLLVSKHTFDGVQGLCTRERALGPMLQIASAVQTACMAYSCSYAKAASLATTSPLASCIICVPRHASLIRRRRSWASVAHVVPYWMALGCRPQLQVRLLWSLTMVQAKPRGMVCMGPCSSVPNALHICLRCSLDNTE